MSAPASDTGASGGFARPALLISAAALFVGGAPRLDLASRFSLCELVGLLALRLPTPVHCTGAYGIKIGVGADAEYKRKVAKDISDGKVQEASGLVTHVETRLNKEVRANY